MDRFVNKKIEKQTIYEIYRACRLCGAGGGYKMPIIQNVVNLDTCDVELKQKIRECVQIEVHQNDKMPPLICELCVDKVNDFYEFLEMCRQTNKRTRLKLGLPPQMMPQWAPDAGDCILGVTEPIFVNDEDSNEPLADKKTKAKGGKVKKEPEKKGKEVRVKLEDAVRRREARPARQRPPSPPRLRRDRRPDPDNVTLSRLQSKGKKCLSPPPRSILKKGTQKKPETSPQSMSPRLKRTREVEIKSEAPAKKVKISLKHLPPRSSKLSARQRRPGAERERTGARPGAERERSRELQTPCPVCGAAFKTPQAMLSHRRCHLVTYTNPKLACNACCAWFASAEEVEAHHKRHRQGLRYRCRRCAFSSARLQAFEEHVEKGKCIPWEEVPDVKCAACWKTFATQTLLDGHRCPGPGARPGECAKCGKHYATQKSLTNHTRSCKKGHVVISPELRRRLLPLQVRVARCDPLLASADREHYDVSGVDANFGLDKNCVYPYISSGLRIKKEPSDCMVKINDLDFESYLHWDSDDDSGDSDADNLDSLDLNSFTKKRKIDSLAACALRTIFSNRFLGKVPRKFRRVKIENIIDSALNNSLSDLNINDDTVSIQKDIIISNKFNDNDELIPSLNNVEKITNDDFDRLFSDSNKPDCDDSVGRSAAVSDDKLVSLGDKDSDERVTKVSDDLDSGAKDVLDKESSDSGNVLNNDKNIDLTQSTNENIEKDVVKEKSSDSEVQQSQENQSDSNGTLSEQKVCLKTDVNSDPENGIIDSPTKRTQCRVVNLNNNENISLISDEDKQNILVNNYSDTNIPSENIDKLHIESNKESRGDDHKSVKSEKRETSNSISAADTENESKDTRVCPKDNYVNSEHNILENNISNESHVKVNQTEINGGADVDGINMNELGEFNCSDYTDDCELMAQIDAQIGEKNHEEPVRRMEIEKPSTIIGEVTKIDKHAVDKHLKLDGSITQVSEEAVKNTEIVEVVKEKEDNEIDTELKQDKITLEDLLPKDDGPCMDLDSISDEDFDFNED